MTQKQKNIRFILYGFLGLIGIVMIGYFLIVRPMQVRAQKANFDKAEAKIDQLAIEIEKLVGKPDEIKKEKSCGRAHLKSERGPLSCSVRHYSLYKNKNFNQSNELLKKIATLSASELRIGTGSKTRNVFVDKTEQNGEQIFYQDFESGSPLNCSYSYSYPATIREFKPETSDNFEVGIICSQSAMQEFFPLKD